MKAHISLVGLLVGLAHAHRILDAVQDAEDRKQALAALQELRLTLPEDVRRLLGTTEENHHLSELQARAILELRLGKATRRERMEFAQELERLVRRLKVGG